MLRISLVIFFSSSKVDARVVGRVQEKLWFSAVPVDIGLELKV